MLAGLGDTARLKKFSSKLSQAPRNVDEKQWAANVVDLHRVLTVVQGLFLTLEHNNEALLRVGVELVTDRKVRKVLDWQDGGWYENDVQREWFRTVVQEKLAFVLKVVTGQDTGGGVASPQAPTTKCSGTNDEDIDTLKRKLEFAEATLANTQAAKLKAEASAQAAASSAHDAEVRARAAEASSKQFQARAQEAEAQALAADARMKEAVVAAEEAASAAEKRVQEAVQAAEIRIQDAETQTRGAEARAQEAGARAEKAETREREVQVLFEQAEARAEEAVETARDATVRTRAAEEGQQKAEQAAAALQEELAEKHKEEIRLRKEVEETNKRIQELDASLLKAKAEAAAKEAELRRQLAEANEELKRQRLLLEEMQAKLKEVVVRSKDNAELRALIKSVGMDSALTAVSVWDRLYSDAKNRISRMETLRTEYRRKSIDILPDVDILADLQHSNLAEQLNMDPVDSLVTAAGVAAPSQRRCSQVVPIRQMGIEGEVGHMGYEPSSVPPRVRASIKGAYPDQRSMSNEHPQPHTHPPVDLGFLAPAWTAATAAAPAPHLVTAAHSTATPINSKPPQPQLHSQPPMDLGFLAPAWKADAGPLAKRGSTLHGLCADLEQRLRLPPLGSQQHMLHESSSLPALNAMPSMLHEQRRRSCAREKQLPC